MKHITIDKNIHVPPGWIVGICDDNIAIIDNVGNNVTKRFMRAGAFDPALLDTFAKMIAGKPHVETQDGVKLDGNAMSQFVKTVDGIADAVESVKDRFGESIGDSMQRNAGTTPGSASGELGFDAKPAALALSLFGNTMTRRHLQRRFDMLQSELVDLRAALADAESKQRDAQHTWQKKHDDMRALRIVLRALEVEKDEITDGTKQRESDSTESAATETRLR